MKQETVGFRGDGEEIAKFSFQNRVLADSEVTVEVGGTASIAIKVAGMGSSRGRTAGSAVTVSVLDGWT
jgi:hypothetical protein